MCIIIPTFKTVCNGPDDGRMTETSRPVIQCNKIIL